MKSYLFPFVFVILFSSMLLPQTKRTQIFVNGGISIPTTPNDFSDYWNKGYNLGVGIGYQLKPQITAIASFYYNSFALNKDKLYTDLGINENLISINKSATNSIAVIANLKFNLINRESLVSPFLQLGIGFYRFSSEASISYFESESTVTFGEVRTAAIWMFGGGLDYNLNELLTLFIYTDYRIGYSDNIQTNYLPISFGVSLHL